ncbi:MAG TPA: cytochrome P450 [Polyangia bacterium]
METTNNATADEFRAAREASGPPDVSWWSVLRGFRADPLRRWTDIREQHGDVARYRFAGIDTFLIGSADGARRVLQDNAANYTKEHRSYRMLRRLFGNGLLTSEGGFWLRQRRLAQPAFHKERIARMGAAMAAAAQATAARWQAETAAAGSGAMMTVAMMDEMSRLTLQIVGDALFGSALSARASSVAASWKVLNRQLVERFARRRLLPPVLPTRYDREFRHARRTLFDVVDAIIAEQRARGGDGDDLLAMFMHARDEDSGERMNDAQLRDEVVTMLLAGHETTAVALTWTWALLDVHREAQARLHEELARVLGGRAPAAADVPSLPFTRAVVSEALRLHPPAYLVNRAARADDVVCGVRVHRGGSILLSPLVLHRHPGYWERPDAFAPERWLDVEAEKRRPRFAFIPFSAGPRQCIGNSFSMMESVLVLATLAQKFAPRLVDGRLPEAEYQVLARPAGDVPMDLVPRT